MKEINETEKEKGELVLHLENIRKQFAQHVLENHKGIPATACHRCIVFSQGILADQAEISDLDKK